MDAYDELASDAPAWYAGILSVLARGKNDEALRQAREQLTIAKENKDQKGQLFANRLIAKAQIGKGDFWNAQKTADESVEIAKATKDKKLLAGTMHMLAQAQVKEKKYDEAEASAKEADSGYKAENFQAGVAAVMSTVASVQFARNDADKALDTANAARDIFKGLGDHNGQASSLKVAVDIKMAENRYYHALLLVEEMVQLYSQGANNEGEAAAQLLAADLQVAQGDLQNAMDRASASAALFHQVGDSKKKGQAVLVMARAFQGAEQLQEATQAAETACSLSQEARDKRGMAAALVVLADCLILQSQFGPASYKLEEAAFVWRQLKDKKEEAKHMALLAYTQVQKLSNFVEMPLQGWTDADKEQPASNAARAAELYSESGAQASSERGRAMVTHASALLGLQRNDEAIAKAVEAQTLFQDNGDLSGQASALFMIGNAYNSKNSSEAAIEAMEKARDLAEEAGEALMYGISVKDVSQKIKDIGRNKTSKKRLGEEGGRQDIVIIRNDVPIIEYFAFEGRAMRTGPTASSSSAALQPGDVGYTVPAKQKVLYNLRMQRVPGVEMTAPQAITA